ncbi:hypothetical protein DdX_00965 [Ditylenchus destructor]|uniref:Uncharacterized protein n=1 Tax=Ditylenchus destructor TaxID=166010 RepID=A0AAD4RAV6_9BILA|nr:hypothetical protein DdX_00965 [Ditylenchus destructor]
MLSRRKRASRDYCDVNVVARVCCECQCGWDGVAEKYSVGRRIVWEVPERASKGICGEQRTPLELGRLWRIVVTKHIQALLFLWHISSSLRLPKPTDPRWIWTIALVLLAADWVEVRC